MSKVSFSSSSRLFHLVFYPDSESYDATSVLSLLVAGVAFVERWAYCLHDSDVDEKHNPLKPHYHLVLSCKYPVKYSRVVSTFGLPESSMSLPDAKSGSRTFRGLVRYLIHADNSNKHQYSISDIVSNFDVSDYFDSASSDAASCAFLDLLEYMSDHQCTRRSVAVYAASNGLLGYYHRFYKMLWDIRDAEAWLGSDRLSSIFGNDVNNND